MAVSVKAPDDRSPRNLLRPCFAAISFCAAIFLGCTIPVVSPSVAARTTVPPSPPATPLTHRPFDTTKLDLTSTLIPSLAGRALVYAGMAIDQGAHVLYLGDQTASGVHVFDIALPTPRYLRTIALASPPVGLALAEDLHRLFIGTVTGAVVVVDVVAAVQPGASLQTLDLGGKGRIDQLIYEPRGQMIFAASSDDHVLTVIDAVHRVAVERFVTGPGPLRLGVDAANGLVYLTDSTDKKVTQYGVASLGPLPPIPQFHNLPCDGIAVNPSTRQGLLSCMSAEGPYIQRLNFNDGKLIARYDQIGGADVMIYSVAADRYLIAAPDFTRGPAIWIYGGPLVVHITNVPVPAGSRGVAYDETNRIVYTADQRAGQAGLLGFPLPSGRP